MDAICECFFLCSLIRLSSVSVVFDFNASLNDVNPASPMLLSVDLLLTEKRLFFDGCYLLIIHS